PLFRDRPVRCAGTGVARHRARRHQCRRPELAPRAVSRTLSYCRVKRSASVGCRAAAGREILRISRFTVLALCVVLAVASGLLLVTRPGLWPLFVVATALSLLGVHDLIQRRHSVRRNYPIIGNI